MVVVGAWARYAARFVEGSNPSAGTRVIVVQLRGHFRTESKDPPGSPPYAHGRRITMLLYGTHAEVADFGIGDGLRLVPGGTSAVVYKNWAV